MHGWYNYSQKKWALAKKSTTITTDDVYVWIPRYAYYTDSSNNIYVKFLYSNKNKTVNENGNLEDIPSNYVIDTTFSGNKENGYWIKISEMSNDETATRLNNSNYGKLIY